jgi:hypothetical protein
LYASGQVHTPRRRSSIARSPTCSIEAAPAWLPMSWYAFGTSFSAAIGSRPATLMTTLPTVELANVGYAVCPSRRSASRGQSRGQTTSAHESISSAISRSG